MFSAVGGVQHNKGAFQLGGVVVERRDRETIRRHEAVAACSICGLDPFNLKRHDLPYHPLWEKGYVSIGDIHTTRSLSEVDDPSELRFFGLKRECGIHESDDGDDATVAA